MGVLRFTEDYDKELMRELIAAKPFSAQYGIVGQPWEEVAAGVLKAIGAQVNAKQVQDRLRLLRRSWKAGELRSTVGSGIEESLDAINEQSHYLCASEIIAENNKRGALRNLEELKSSSESVDDTASNCGSVATQDSASTSSTPAKSTGKKRANAFEAETERLYKRAREEFDLCKQQCQQKMEWQKQKHTELLELERIRASAREKAEKQNRELILECAKIFGAARTKK